MNSTTLHLPSINSFTSKLASLLLIASTILFNSNVLGQQNPGCVTPDVVAPVITPLPNNISIVLGPTGTKTITLADIATITDNCNPNPPYTLSTTSFNCSHRGQQTITVTATDGVFASPQTPSAVSFSQVYGVAIDASGNIYLADVVNQLIRKISTTGVVSTLAGNGIRGYADGTGTSASFNNPLDLAVDGTGNIYVADQGNNRIRKITPAGVVTTFAGSGVPGFADGTGTASMFKEPYGLTIDAAGNLYIADTENNRIRKITPAGVVTTIAGSTAGYQDGPASVSKFYRPMDVAVDGSGNLYVVDEANRRIRLIDVAGNVSTFAGNGSLGFINGTGTSAAFNGAFHLSIDASGNLYLADANNHAIRKITPAAVVTTIAGNGTNGSADGAGSSAQFFYPYGIAVDATGNIIIGDGLNYKIRKINTANVVSTLAGSGVSGNQNGSIGSPATGNQTTEQITVTIVQSPPVITSAPQPEITIAIGADCTAPIPDFKSSATATSGCGVVMLTQSPTQGVPAPLGRRPVTIIATDIYGMESYQTSYINIVDATAPVITPLSNNIIIPLNANGTRTVTLADIAAVADNCNSNPLYTISPSSFNCSTTGLRNITVTATDGTFGTPLTPGAATFYCPFGLDFDAAGNLYIADQENNKIRKITPSGVVSTLAGNGNEGYADGTGSAAMFDDPRGIAIDAAGNVYTSDIDNHRIRKITPAGVVTTFAGGAQGFANGTGANAQFSSPRGLAFDAQGNLYVADAYNARIRKITPSGVVTTVAGTGSFSSVDGPVATASIYDPVDVAVDAAGNIYVAEASGNKIRKISASGMVSTVAGDGTYGFNDGPGNTAKFSGPQALSVDGNGNIYVADLGTNRIRKINTSNVVSTIAISGYPSGVTVRSNGDIYMTDFIHYIKMISPTGVVTTLAGANQNGSQDGNIGILATGNQSVLQIPVTITGQSTPVFSTMQGNVSVAASASCQAVLANYSSTASASSSCGGAVAITQSPSAGTVLSIGSTNVILTATDASNNTATQTFTVTVTDNNGPVITPLSSNIIIPLGANGSRTITRADVVNISDCSPSTEVRITPSTFTCADIGNRTITVEATDGSFGTGPNPAAVSFASPQTAVVDAAGNLYVAANNQIRKISVTGEVTTLAGSGVAATVDGTGLAASFNELHGLSIDAAGNLYTAEIWSRKVRKVSPAGVVTTVAGTGAMGSNDGPAASASFIWVFGVAVDAQGNIYVVDAGSYKIRKISTSGIVSTYAGTGALGSIDGPANTATFNYPSSIAIDNAGNIYVGEQFKIRKITPGGIVSTFAGSNVAGNLPGTGTNARIARPMGMVFDAAGNLFATQEGEGRIIKITPAAEVSNFAGHYGETTINGTGTAATFRSPEGLGIDASGNLYVADWFLNNIRKITPSAVVTTFAGSGVAGSQNGNINGITGNYSSIQLPIVIKDASAPVINPASSNIVLPLNSNGTRTISLADIATVIDNCNSNPSVRFNPSTFDCSNLGVQMVTVESTDGLFSAGAAANASFHKPVAITTAPNGTMYVADRGSESIRRITADGEVILFAGTPASSGGFADGQGVNARFMTVLDLTTDAAGNIYVADAGNRRIRKITPGGLVTTVAGNGTPSSIDGIGTAASFESPNALTIDAAGNLYVADASKIRKITPGGNVTTIAGSTAGFADGNGLAAKFWGPSGLTMDAAGNLYIADGANYRIRKMTPPADVTTLAGGNNEFGFLDAIVRDADGNLYVCDSDNHMIKKLSATGIITTVAGSGMAGSADGTGTAASFNGIFGMTMNGGQLYVSEFYNNKIRKVTTSGVVRTFAGSGSPFSIDGNIGGISGNYSSMQIPVTIIDNTAPVINCPANITTPTTNIQPNQTGSATATDNCTASSAIVITYTDNTGQGCNMQRTWKATDVSGNFSICVQSIAIPQMTVSLGQDMYVLFGALGYVGCKTIIPVITGGVAPYTYSWNSSQASVNNSTSASISVCNTTEVTHTYTVTVTAANGCIATSSLQLTFINISCSNNNNNVKVTVCLRPQGNPNNCNTVCVSESAAQVLINNGSYYGKCLPNCEIPVQGKTVPVITSNNQLPVPSKNKPVIQTLKAPIIFDVIVANNPTHHSFELRVNTQGRKKISMRLFDMSGRTIELKQNVMPGEIINIGGGYISGTYFAEIVQGENRKIVKLVKQ